MIPRAHQNFPRVNLDRREVRHIVLDYYLAAGELNWDTKAKNTPFIVLIPKVSKGKAFNCVFVANWFPQAVQISDRCLY